jgi:hypothetical protein
LRKAKLAAQQKRNLAERDKREMASIISMKLKLRVIDE